MNVNCAAHKNAFESFANFSEAKALKSTGGEERMQNLMVRRLVCEHRTRFCNCASVSPEHHDKLQPNPYNPNVPNAESQPIRADTSAVHGPMGDIMRNNVTSTPFDGTLQKEVCELWSGVFQDNGQKVSNADRSRC